MEYGCILGPCFSLLCGWELWVTLLLRKELSIWSWGFFGAGLVITMVKHWSLVLLWLYSLHGLEDESSSWNCKEAALDFWGGCWFWRGVRWLYWPRGLLFSCLSRNEVYYSFVNWIFNFHFDNFGFMSFSLEFREIVFLF